MATTAKGRRRAPERDAPHPAARLYQCVAAAANSCQLSADPVALTAEQLRLPALLTTLGKKSSYRKIDELTKNFVFAPAKCDRKIATSSSGNERRSACRYNRSIEDTVSASTALAITFRHDPRWHRTSHTSGLADQHVQGNVVILPEAQTNDFRFCQQNPKALPTARGIRSRTIPAAYARPTVDIRTDVPRYRVWQHGQLTDEPTDIASIWRDDLVTFIIGCSFSFEQALLEGWFAASTHRAGQNVAMFRPSIATNAVGHFAGRWLFQCDRSNRLPPYARSSYLALSAGTRLTGSRGFAASDRHP